MANRRGLLLAALILLTGALVAGILTMHVPLMGLMGAHTTMHSPTSTSPLAASSTDPVAGTGPKAASVAALEMATTTGGAPVAQVVAESCHLDTAGHGSSTSAHATTCTLYSPPGNAGSMLGAAALVAVVMLGVLALPQGLGVGRWLRRRGPPRGQKLHLSLCVIRV